VLAGNELGQLAAAFNHMAEVLAGQRARLIEGERRRRDAELQQRLLENEYARKTAELEEARQFQLSLLPRTLPDHPRYAVAASMTTATEVGGDYYDFRVAGDGTLTAAIGDATGHGVKAGTLVTVVKSLFSAYADVAPLSTFLGEASDVIRRMGLERMLMSVALVRFEGAGMTIAAAGMPPVLVYRASDGAVEEYVLPGMPLGGLAYDYRELRVPLSAGDAVLLMSDGLPESPGAGDDPLGYGEVARLFGGLGSGEAEAIVAGLNAAAAERAGDQGLSDDVTFVVFKVRP
jgi:serine phosphatase RsbU (regulator of sigma subunit)